MFKTYYQLAKPGIIYGNSITAMAGFFLASRVDINWLLFIAMLVGLGLVMGGACVFNNYLDRDIDAHMARTKDRATVTGSISKNAVLAYGSTLLVLGAVILYFYTNILTLVIALAGTIVYVGLYTPLKRVTMHSALVGSLAGAVPPVVGYCAVTGRFDIAALILFFILVFWQMPHFYAIAIYRGGDYGAASVPVLPIVKGTKAAKSCIIVYILCFIISTVLLATADYLGNIYLVVALALGLIWLWLALKGIRSNSEAANILWAKRVFLFSLVVIAVLSAIISISATFNLK